MEVHQSKKRTVNLAASKVADVTLMHSTSQTPKQKIDPESKHPPDSSQVELCNNPQRKTSPAEAPAHSGRRMHNDLLEVEKVENACGSASLCFSKSCPARK